MSHSQTMSQNHIPPFYHHFTKNAFGIDFGKNPLNSIKTTFHTHSKLYSPLTISHLKPLITTVNPTKISNSAKFPNYNKNKHIKNYRNQ